MTQTPLHNDERRAGTRIPADPLHAIIVDIEEDAIMVPGTVVAHDISVTGVRGKWERPLPDGTFSLRLEIGEGVEVRARAAWQRPLPGGQVLAGVSFSSVDPPGRSSLDRFLAALQGPPRRRSPRYADALPVEVIWARQSLTAVASDVSADGLQIATDEALPEGDEVVLLMPLTWGVPVEVPATLRWRRENQHGGHAAGLEFGPLSPDARAAVIEYLSELTE